MADKTRPHRRKATRGRPKAGESVSDGVSSVSFHSGRNLWQIVYFVGGKRNTAYRVKEKSAQSYAAKLHARLSTDDAAPTIDIPVGRGLDREDWAGGLWSLATHIVRDPSNEEYQRALKAVSAGAAAAAKFVDNAAIVAKVDRLEQIIESNISMRKRGSNADSERSGSGAPHTTLLC